MVSVDINNRELQARGLAPSDVVNAISLQNLILPSGTVKLEGSEYAVSLNSSPTTIAVPMIAEMAMDLLFNEQQKPNPFKIDKNMMRLAE